MKRVLLDTNVLMLLVIGSLSRDLIGTHRRTQQFTPSDFDLLQGRLQVYDPVITTPAILTELSNLMWNDFHEIVSQTMINVCRPFVELISPKEEVFAAEGFDRLGFADASILASLDPETTVLTDDVALYLQVLYMGKEAINFNHLRNFE
jgi:hypothetical protein